MEKISFDELKNWFVNDFEKRKSADKTANSNNPINVKGGKLNA